MVSPFVFSYIATIPAYSEVKPQSGHNEVLRPEPLACYFSVVCSFPLPFPHVPVSPVYHAQLNCSYVSICYLIKS